MTKSPDEPKTPPRKGNKRAGLDIAFPVSKGLSFSDSDAAAAKDYYNTADPYTDGEQSNRWFGKGAALLGLSADNVCKTMERIESEMKAHVPQGGKRSGRVTGETVWVEVTHHIAQTFPLKPPQTNFPPNNGVIPVADPRYRFRAECLPDVVELCRLLGEKFDRITMTIEPPFPDVEVTLEIGLSLEELRDVMRRVVDGHVMVQTVAGSEEYTGERDYER